MHKVSAYILTFNEAEKIGAAVQSVLWADEIVVVDSASNDGTIEIVEKFGARVVQIPFSGFGELRNQAVAACRNEWVFSLDADERCTEAVRDEVLGLLASGPAHDVYQVPRRNFFMGQWITGSGWYPNYRQPQFFRRGALLYKPDQVHEGYELRTDKPVGKLDNAIWQFPFAGLDEVISKLNRYSTLGVSKISHRQVSMSSALLHAAWAFFKHLVMKRGFKDGWAGFVIALQSFEGTFYRYAKRYEQQQGWAPPPAKTIGRPD